MDEEVHGVAIDGLGGEGFAELLGEREDVIGGFGHGGVSRAVGR